LKAGQIQLADFESRPEPTRRFFKDSQSQLADFESRPEPISPVFQSFLQIQKLFALNGKEFINST
jgi:hypothetical protein